MNQTIALIDDDRNILTSISIALEKEGFKVQTYLDGESALIGLTRQPPDLAVIDIKMPKMDGEELLKKLRKKTTLPVIFLTSKDDEIDELLGLKLGADDFVKKSGGFSTKNASLGHWNSNPLIQYIVIVFMFLAGTNFVLSYFGFKFNLSNILIWDSKNVVFGLYTCAGTFTCVGGRPGSKGHWQQDADVFAEWGVDWVKMDWCNTNGMTPQTTYPKMSQAMNKTGWPIHFNMCEWGVNNPWEWGDAIAQSWRCLLYTSDAADE